MRLVLTGFMGTGKSSVGRVVANRLGRRFLDTDTLVEEACGQSVPDIFARQGEPFFRAREREAIERACEVEEAIIATGGGAIVDPSNLERLQRGALVVCLVATPQVIAARVLSRAEDRPLLSGRGAPATERIAELLAERQAAYERVPVRIDTSELSEAEVARRVQKALAEAEAS